LRIWRNYLKIKSLKIRTKKDLTTTNSGYILEYIQVYVMKQKNVTYPLKIPIELYVKAKQFAEKEDRTVAYIIRQGLKEFFERRESK